MTLSQAIRGKENNFNLIRIIAALAVLTDHCYALLRLRDPMDSMLGLGMSLGSVAVDIFFIVSGFLVTGSLITRQNLRSYIRARVLRIYPALIMTIFLTVFLLGAYFTTFTLGKYFSAEGTYRYLWKCAVLITNVIYTLPGVFESNPFHSAVNGSLWTIVYELKMYLVLSLLWWSSGLWKKFRLQLFQGLIISLTVVALVLVNYHHIYLRDTSNTARFAFLFFCGATYFVLKDRIHLSTRLFAAIAFMWLITALLNTQIFFIVYQLSLAYLIFYLAYIPAGTVRRYNLVGDYSYGVYIYAFPIQQSMIALVPGISPLQVFCYALTITLVFAVLSWHLIEKPALRWKNYLEKTHPNGAPIGSIPFH